MVNTYTFIFIFGLVSGKIASQFNYGMYILITIVALFSTVAYFRDRRGEYQQSRQMVRRALSTVDKGLIAAQARISENQQIVNNSFSYMSDVVLPMLPFVGTFSRIGCALSKAMGYKPSAARHTAAVIRAMDAGVKELEHLFEADPTGIKGLQCILEGGGRGETSKHSTFRDGTTTLESIQSTTCSENSESVSVVESVTPLHEHDNTSEISHSIVSTNEVSVTSTFHKHENVDVQ